MKRIFNVIFSAEFFFAMFLFVGYFKEAIGFQIDLAAVFLGLTILTLIKRLIINPTIVKSYLIPIGLIGLFFIYIMMGYFYGPSIANAQDKLIKIVALTIPATIIPFFMLKTNNDVKRLTESIVLIAIGSALYALPSAVTSLTGFVGYGEAGNYQGLARLTGAGLIILMFYTFVNAKSKSIKTITVILVLVFSFVLLSSGSRMPIVALGIVVAYYLLTSVRISEGVLYAKKELKYIVGLLAISIPILIYMNSRGFFETILFRFEVLFSDGGGTSVQGRTERFDQSIAYLGNSPLFGNGIGSYGYMYTGRDINDYPHNLFLEVLSENGMIGLLLLTVVLGYATYAFSKTKKNNLTYIWLFLTIYFGFNAMVSGDINSNRMLFSALSVLIIISQLNRSPQPQTKEKSELSVSNQSRFRLKRVY